MWPARGESGMGASIYPLRLVGASAAQGLGGRLFGQTLRPVRDVPVLCGAAAPGGPLKRLRRGGGYWQRDAGAV